MLSTSRFFSFICKQKILTFFIPKLDKKKTILMYNYSFILPRRIQPASHEQLQRSSSEL